MSPDLYLPPAVAEQKRREFAAEILKRVTVEDPRAREFTALLQQMNPDLFMVKAHDKIAPGTPLRAGFYHVLKRNEGAPMTVIPITENDRYVEPDSRLFAKLAQNNMTQQRVVRELEDQDRVVERAVQREQAGKRDDRREELKDRVNAAVRAQVSLDRSIPWTQNSQGRRPKT